MVQTRERSDEHGIRPVLCRSLESLLQRDRSFAQAFIQDRRTFERIMKCIVLSAGHDEQQQQSRRLERSACLHCIVLAFRLARVDDFASEIALPVLIAGALSGVVQYPALQERPSGEGQRRNSPPSKSDGGHDCQQTMTDPWPSTALPSAQELASHVVVNPLLEDIEDGAQSILEALEARSLPLPSGSSTPRGGKEEGLHTSRSNTSTMTPNSTYAITSVGAGMEPHARSEASRVTAGITHGEDFDDPATCGTFALRRLCMCGLGFALLPPLPGTAVLAKPAAATGQPLYPRRKHPGNVSPGSCYRTDPNPTIITAVVEPLVVLAHGDFLHPDAAVLADFLRHGQDRTKSGLSGDRYLCQHQQGTAAGGQTAEGQHFSSALQQQRGEGMGGTALILPRSKEVPPPDASTSSSSVADHGSRTTSGEKSSILSVPTPTIAILESATCGVPNCGESSARSRGGQNVEVAAGAEGRAEGGKDGNTVPITSPTRGGRGLCLICARKNKTTKIPFHSSFSTASSLARGVTALRSMARLLLAQISVSDLRKAQARSFGHAKRRARATAAIEANKPPPVAKRAIGFNDRMNAGGHNSNKGIGINAESDGRVLRCRDGSSSGSKCEGQDATPETAGDPGETDIERNNRTNIAPLAALPSHSDRISNITSTSRCAPNACPSCRIVVLGHPLDTISTRCGGGVVTRSSLGEQSLPGGAAGTMNTSAYQAGKPDKQAANTENGWKQAGLTKQPKSIGGVGIPGAITAEGARGKRTSSIGVAAVSQALGDRAVEIVAEQLGSAIQARCSKHDATVAKLAELHTRGKQAKELKLDRKIDFRRRLAAAADEARQETETVALRRRLLRGGPSDPQTSRGVGGADDDGDPAVMGRAGTARAAPAAGHDLGNEPNWDEDGNLVEPDPGAAAAAGEASALSLARWNQHQEKEQARRLQELMVEMKHAIDGGEIDGEGRRPTFRRGSSGGSSRSASTSGRGSISGSGIYRDLARGADAAHSAILSSMRVDGVDTRAYLEERRRVFHGVSTEEEEERNAYLLQPGNNCETGKLEGLSTGGTTDWESTTEPSFGAAHDDGGCGLDEKPPNIGHGPRSSGSGGGGVGGGSANTSTTGTGGGDGDASVGTADEVVAGKKARAVARDAEQLRLARARRAAKEERLQIEKREAIEAERGARRRAKDRAEAARNERRAQTLARKEMQRRKEALDLQEEQARVEKEKSQKANSIAIAAERKRQGKLRRARERERRKIAAFEKERHEEEMARIERWRKEEHERALEAVRKEEETTKVVQAKAIAKLAASTREEEQRRAEVEAKRLSLKAEREVAAARLSRGEFRYLRGRLVFHEAKGALLMPVNNSAHG